MNKRKSRERDAVKEFTTAGVEEEEEVAEEKQRKRDRERRRTQRGTKRKTYTMGGRGERNRRVKEE